MSNVILKNGVSGILIPMSFISSEAIDPVLINTQVAVYTDNRTTQLDAMAVKNELMSWQEQAVAEKAAFHLGDFHEDFHRKNAQKYSKIAMLLGYFHNGRTYPISMERELHGSHLPYRKVSKMQVVYSDPMKGIVVDAKVTRKVVPHFEEIIPLLLSVVPEVETEGALLADIVFELKKRLEYTIYADAVDIFIKKGANTCMLENSKEEQ